MGGPKQRAATLTPLDQLQIREDMSISLFNMLHISHRAQHQILSLSNLHKHF